MFQESPVVAHLSVALRGAGGACGNLFAPCSLPRCLVGFAAAKFKAVASLLGVLGESRIEAVREKRQWGKGEGEVGGVRSRCHSCVYTVSE